MPISMRAPLLPEIFAGAVLLLTAAPVAAQDDRADTLQESFRRCIEAEVPVVAAASCSAAIDSGRLREEVLPRAYLMRCYAYAQLGRVERAEPDCERSLAMEAPPVAHRVRAFVHRLSRRHDDAIASIDAALKGEPDRWQDFRFRGVTNNWRGRHDAAVADFTKALALGAPPSLLTDRAVAHFGRRDWSAAEADIEKAFAAASDDLSAYHDRGRLRFFRGEWKGARADFEQAADLAPHNAYMTLAAYLAAAFAGDADAGDMLRRRAESLDLGEWPGQLVEVFLGRRAPEAVTPPAHPLEIERVGHRVETEYYLGLRDLLAGNREAARARFSAALAVGATEHNEHLGAGVELERLQR